MTGCRLGVASFLDPTGDLRHVEEVRHRMPDTGVPEYALAALAASVLRLPDPGISGLTGKDFRPAPHPASRSRRANGMSHHLALLTS